MLSRLFVYYSIYMEKAKQKALNSIQMMQNASKKPVKITADTFNKVMIKKAFGKPKKYPTPEKMEKAINEYITTCMQYNQPCTITGLSLWLGFTSRQDLINYEGYGSAYHDTLKKAKSFIANEYEKRLFYEGNPAGAIFALKNFDWKDKQETDITTKGQALKNVNIVSFAPVQNDKKTVNDTQETDKNDTLSTESLPDNSIGE